MNFIALAKNVWTKISYAMASSIVQMVKMRKGVLVSAEPLAPAFLLPHKGVAIRVIMESKALLKTQKVKYFEISLKN